jgi:uncharacterized protein
MQKAFWILAGIEAVALVTLLVMGSNERGHNDGGREMGLLFFGILPLTILIGVSILFAAVPISAVRWLCLGIVSLPLGFYGFFGFARIGLHFINDPANSYSGDMRKLVSAANSLDVEGVQRWAPRMDKSVDQGHHHSPMRLVIEKMVKEQQTRLPAQTERHLAILKILIENGARSEEAMEVACWTKSAELFAAMFKAGADPNYVTRYGGPVFHHCLHPGMGVPGPELPVIQEFVKAGVDVNARSNIGTLAASDAVALGKYDIAEYLLEHGANPDLKDENGVSLREVVTRKLAEVGAKTPPELAGLGQKLK